MFPLDWSHPLERALYIARETDARLVVTGIERHGAFESAGQAAIGLEDEIGDIAACEPLFFEESTAITPQHLAYVIYTSGSTGRPKGVMIRHRNIVFQIHSESAVLDLTPGRHRLCRCLARL